MTHRKLEMWREWAGDEDIGILFTESSVESVEEDEIIRVGISILSV